MFHILETRDFERSIIKLLLTQSMTARAYFNRVDGEKLTSKYRIFIFETAKRIFFSTKSLLTYKLFVFELEGVIPDKEREDYIAEWNLITGMVVDENAEAILEELEKAILANNIANVIEEAAENLEKGDVDSALNFLRSKAIKLGTKKETRPVTLATDIESERKLISEKKTNPEKYQGIKTGFWLIDSKTGGLYPAELTMIAAITGVGKSTIMKMLGYNIIHAGKNILHITNEESCDQVRRKFQSLFSNIPYLDFKKATITDEQIVVWEARINELNKAPFGKIYIKELPPYHNAIDVDRVFLELQQKGIKIDVIFIDYLDHMKPIEKAYNENDEQGKAAMDCKGLAVYLNVPVITATQAATDFGKKQAKGKGARMGPLDVYGSKRKIHESNTFIGISQGDKDRTPTDREEWEFDVFWNIAILKNRDGPPFSFDAKHIVKTGHVVYLTKGESSGVTDATVTVAVDLRADIEKEEAEISGDSKPADLKEIKKIRIPVTKKDITDETTSK